MFIIPFFLMAIVVYGIAQLAAIVFSINVFTVMTIIGLALFAILVGIPMIILGLPLFLLVTIPSLIVGSLLMIVRKLTSPFC